MAALSSRNFLAPFQNKLQLGTIIILATLVALFRLSNGDLATRMPDRRYNSPAVSDVESQEPALKSRSNIRQDSDPFADILNEKPKAPAKVNQPDSSPKNLDEVRKALGLE